MPKLLPGSRSAFASVRVAAIEGMACVAILAGLWWIWPPLALVLGGAAALLWAVGHDDSDVDRPG